MQIRINARSSGELGRFIIANGYVVHPTYINGGRAIVEASNRDCDELFDRLDEAGFAYDFVDDEDRDGSSGGIRSYEDRQDQDDGDMSQAARMARRKAARTEERKSRIREPKPDEFMEDAQARLLSDGVPADESQMLSTPRKKKANKRRGPEGDECWYKMPKYRP